MKFSVKKSFVGAVTLATALSLAACSPANEEDSTAGSAEVTTTTTSSSATTSAAAETDAPLTVTDAVVRASVEDSMMTAIFATITNNTDEDINITGFTSDADAERFELHEVVDGVMQEKPGGFIVPAGGSIELAPGQDHMMLMGLGSPIEAGDEVNVTLTLGDGTELELEPIQARTIAAGDEDYGQDGELQGHSGMDEMAN